MGLFIQKNMFKHNIWRRARRLKPKLLKGLPRDTAAILCYHGIHAGDIPFSVWTQISAEQFETHLAFLSGRYELIHLSELERRLDNGLRGNPVVLTFDDGYTNNFFCAFPLLKKYRVPATIFVTAGAVGTDKMIWTDQVATILAAGDWILFEGETLPLHRSRDKATAYRSIVNFLKTQNPVEIRDWIEKEMTLLRKNRDVLNPSCFSVLNWEQIQTMRKSGLIEIGSHGLDHFILSKMSPETAEAEIRGAKAVIEDRIGPVTAFAYPNGAADDFSELHRVMLQNSGFRMALTTSPLRVTGRVRRMEIPRICVGHKDTVEVLNYRITRSH